MHNEFENEANLFRTRFMSHIPADSSDISLAVLKGHLLAEELLADYISYKVNYPEHLKLENNHWNFANKIELAASLASDQHHDIWVWHALKKLNTLRNKLSHGLEPKGLDQIISDFQYSITPHVPKLYQDKEITTYECVLFTVTGLFIVIKSDEGKIK